MDKNKTLDAKREEALKGIWDSLTDEQREKAKACKTLDELTALAGREGIELPDELLDAVAGGYIYWNWYDGGMDNVWQVIRDRDGDVMARFPSGCRADAEKYAAEHGWHTDLLSDEELKRLRKYTLC